jgi:PAS domain S-box-containing protein
MGIALAMLYWLVESAIHTFAFDFGGFLSQLLTVDPHELWKRILVAALLVAFGVFAQRVINVIRRTGIALSTSEKKYSTLFQEALNPIFVLDQEGRFTEANQATLDFFECEASQLASTALRDSTQALQEIGTPGAFHPEACQGAIEVCFEVNGRHKTLLLNLAAVQLNDVPNLYFGIGQDISERMIAESNLKLAHAELEQIFQTASSAMRLIDSDFNILKINQTFARLSSVKAEDAIGARCYEVFAGEHCHTKECPLLQVTAGEDEIRLEVIKRRHDDTSVPCLLTARPFLAPDGALLGIVESFNDITELKRVQEDLRTERDRLRQILFQQFEGVGIVRSDFTVEYQNEALIDEIGELEGMPCYMAFLGKAEPCAPCLMQEALSTGRPHHCELPIAGRRLFEHTYTPFRDANGVHKVLVLLRDISDRKASRAAVIRSEQMAAIGELAAGVAHEINNPINGVLNYAEILIDNHPDLASVTSIATRIVSESERIAKIVQSLLAFSRRDAESRIAVSLGDLLLETLTITNAQLRRSFVQVSSTIEEKLPPVVCAPQEIQQVFLNLMSNARDALDERFPDGDPDKILAITAVRESTRLGPCVTVWFRDQGVGIPPHLIAKVTSPFFSTKPKGFGTGLGLTISNEIIVEHGGQLLIESKEGESTRVGVRLPIPTPSTERTDHESGEHPGR